MAQKKKRLKLGIVANEFLDTRIGRAGGFGWAARQAARCFTEDPNLGVDVVFLAGSLAGASGQSETTAHDTRLLFNQPGRWNYLRAVRGERIDLLLTVDYRPDYRRLFWMLPRTPIIVWVRDPRSAEDVTKVGTLRIPGAEDVRPGGISPINCTSLADVVRASKVLRRPVLIASKMPYLDEKIPGTYGVKASGLVLPNPEILDCPVGTVVKSERPRVVFLGRLDPIKRPWLFVELARRFPNVEFLVVGQAHFDGPRAWQPAALPDNVKLLGHVDGKEKVEVLSSAWALVNTSIHEEAPVSMFEALACETPLLACMDSGKIVSDFGVFAGRFDGTGMDALPQLAEGLARLLNDGGLRARLGKAGRRWVAENHGKEAFLAAFDRLCARAGLAS